MLCNPQNGNYSRRNQASMFVVSRRDFSNTCADGLQPLLWIPNKRNTQETAGSLVKYMHQHTCQHSPVCMKRSVPFPLRRGNRPPRTTLLEAISTAFMANDSWDCLGPGHVEDPPKGTGSHQRQLPVNQYLPKREGNERRHRPKSEAHSWMASAVIQGE